MTASDAKDVVAKGLYDPAAGHLEQWKGDAADEIDGISSSFLRLGHAPGRSFGIHDSGQSSQDAADGGGEGGHSVGLQLDLNIAQAGAGEPGGGIVIVPDHSIDKRDEIGIECTGDEDGGTDVAIPEVPGQWGKDECGDQEGKGAKEHGAGVGVLGLLGCWRRWGHGAHVVSGTAVGMPCGRGVVS